MSEIAISHIVYPCVLVTGAISVASRACKLFCAEFCSHKRKISFADIPTDVVAHCTGFLSFRELCRDVAPVSRTFHQAAVDAMRRMKVVHLQLRQNTCEHDPGLERMLCCARTYIHTAWLRVNMVFHSMFTCPRCTARALDLHCRSSVEEALAVVGRYCRHVRKLRVLETQESVTFWMLWGQHLGIPVKTLSDVLAKCPGLESPQFVLPSGVIKSLKGPLAIETLHQHINSPDDLTAIARKCTRLQRLSLMEVASVTVGDEDSPGKFFQLDEIFQNCSQLKCLELLGFELAPESIRNLRYLDRLTHLNLSQCGIVDKLCVLVAKFVPRLRRLSLEKNPDISNEGIKSTASLDLEALDICITGIDPELFEFLALPAVFPNLSWLHLDDGFVQDCTDVFGADKPNCEVTGFDDYQKFLRRGQGCILDF
eukprot:14650_1